MFSIWNRIISFSGKRYTNVYTFNSSLTSTNQNILREFLIRVNVSIYTWAKKTVAKIGLLSGFQLLFFFYLTQIY